ncbi:MAG: hypothetical protein M9921_07230 [Fimbriimonadaceae bacterium]|nr:hypothetical protein [Fimbriimonadaceae bacterium]
MFQFSNMNTTISLVALAAGLAMIPFLGLFGRPAEEEAMASRLSPTGYRPASGGTTELATFAAG